MKFTLAARVYKINSDKTAPIRRQLSFTFYYYRKYEGYVMLQFSRNIYVMIANIAGNISIIEILIGKP